MQRKEILPVVGSGRGGTSSYRGPQWKVGWMVSCVISSWENEIGILVSFSGMT